MVSYNTLDNARFYPRRVSFKNLYLNNMVVSYGALPLPLSTNNNNNNNNHFGEEQIFNETR